MNIHLRYTRAEDQAIKRGLAWRITVAEYTSLLALPCHYCRSPLALTGVGLDRLDNDEGYTFDNVVPCCGPCNLLKGWLLTPAEMLAVVALLIKLRGGAVHWEQHRSRHT